MEPILDFAHATTAVVWYAFFASATLNCNRALDMWWLGVAVFVVCIIEVSIWVVDFPLPYNTNGTTSVLVLPTLRMKVGSTYSPLVSISGLDVAMVID